MAMVNPDTFIRILLYIALGCTLIAANIWYGLRVIALISNTAPHTLAPFQVIGKEDKDGKLGTALSHMLIGRIAKIRKEMEASAVALEAAQNASGSPYRASLAQSTPLSLPFPEAIFVPPDIEFSLGGVEVGGLFSWIVRQLGEERMVHFTVEFTADRAILVGKVGDRYGGALYVDDVEPRNDAIAEAIAYSIVQLELAKRIPEVNALELKEFKVLLSTLHQAAQLNKRIALGRAIGEEFQPLLANMKALAAKMERWKPLLELAGQMARNSNDNLLALDFYRRLLEQSKDSASDRDRVTTIVADLEQALANTVGNPVAATGMSPKASTLSFTQQLRQTRGAVQLLKLVGVDHFDMSKEVRIAVLGGTPTPGLLPDNRIIEIPAEIAVDTPDAYMQEYMDTVISSVLMIADHVRIMVTPVPSSSEVGS